MSELEALLLGVIQGLTEFLPISSSGHLVLVPWLFDFQFLKENPDFNKTFDVAVHMGTLAAVVTYFRVLIKDLIASFFTSVFKRRIETDSERLAWLVVIATIPAAIAGALGESFIEESLGEPWQVALLLAGFALLLYAADRMPQRRKMDGLKVGDAVIVGFAQVLSLAPGTSRSGITITAGRFLGLDRDSAARFSFLLLAPIVAGAGIFKGVGVAQDGLPPGSIGPIIVGVVSAAASGFAAIWAVLALVRRHNYNIFVWYRLVLAAVVLLVIAFGLRPATF